MRVIVMCHLRFFIPRATQIHVPPFVTSFMMMCLILLLIPLALCSYIDEVAVNRMETRYDFPLVADPVSNTLIFSGGATPNSLQFWADDVVAYSPLTGFTKIYEGLTLDASAFAPQARSIHIAAIYNNKVLILRI